MYTLWSIYYITICIQPFLSLSLSKKVFFQKKAVTMKSLLHFYTLCFSLAKSVLLKCVLLNKINGSEIAIIYLNRGI